MDLLCLITRNCAAVSILACSAMYLVACATGSGFRTIDSSDHSASSPTREEIAAFSELLEKPVAGQDPKEQSLKQIEDIRNEIVLLRLKQQAGQ